MFTVITSKEVG